VRHALLVGIFAIAGCAVRGSPGWVIAPGGSVTDFDRSPAGSAGWYEFGTPSGAPDTLGIASVDGMDRRASGPVGMAGIEPITPGPLRSLVAGPPQLGRLISDPETIRTLERALADRGYYQGPIDGLASPGLADAIGRFQTDHKLPATGRLDGETAAALGVPLRGAPPPPGSG
jgi:localization factor PodJL